MQSAQLLLTSKQTLLFTYNKHLHVSGVIPNPSSGLKHYKSVLKILISHQFHSSVVLLCNLEDGTDSLSPNAEKILPIYAAYNSRTAQI